jgi:hypothetical protein
VLHQLVLLSSCDQLTSLPPVVVNDSPGPSRQSSPGFPKRAAGGRGLPARLVGTERLGARSLPPVPAAALSQLLFARARLCLRLLGLPNSSRSVPSSSQLELGVRGSGKKQGFPVQGSPPHSSQVAGVMGDLDLGAGSGSLGCSSVRG